MDYYKLLIFPIYNMYKTCIKEKSSAYSGWVFLGLLTDEGRKKVSLQKVCHTHSTMMKLDSFTLSEEDPKEHINQVTSSLSFPEISISSPEFTNLVISKNTNVNCILIHSL